MISVATNQKVSIRNPNATRPWQHVLEPLSGYLIVGQKLLEERKEFATSWNFGPTDEGTITVEEVVKSVKKYWDKIEYEIDQNPDNLHEANLLKLDCTKANTYLNWYGVWNSNKTFEMTVKWYKEFYENKTILTINDLTNYINSAKDRGLEWVS
jgi:CDP-glucose 4,6-dehydratase